MAVAAAGSYLLSDAQSFGFGLVAAMLIGLGTGGESDIVPYLLSRYYGLRSFSALYGAAWMVGAGGGALGPILMGKAFDTVGSYEQVLVRLSMVALGAAALTLVLPRYEAGLMPPAATAT